MIGNTTVDATTPNNLVMTILEGIDRKTNTNHAFMPSFKHELNDQQVAAIANFVSNTFGTTRRTITADQVREIVSGGPAPPIKAILTWGMSASVLIMALMLMLYLRSRRPAARGI